MEYVYLFLVFVSIYFNLQLPPLATSIFFCFSNDQGAVFLFFFFFFLFLSVPSSVYQCHHEGGDFFGKYGQSNWRWCLGYYLCVLFSPVRSRTCSSPIFLTIYLLYCPPAAYFNDLQIFPLQFP